MTPGIPTKAAEILRAETHIGRFSIGTHCGCWIYLTPTFATS